MDDNFCFYSHVLRWGRCVYINIRNSFTAHKNCCSLLWLTFGQHFWSVKSLSLPVRLLWVSLIVNTLGALALVTEQPAKELIENPHLSRTQPLVTNVILRNLFSQAFYQIVILLILQFRGESLFGLNENLKDTLTSATATPDDYASWKQCNDVILSWILNSLTQDLADSVIFSTTAQEVWEDLWDRFSQRNAPRIFQIERGIACLAQDQMTVAAQD
ncbi:hypothetical protein Pint_07601 [Pistacia integerrima]|uniref:Uncharacterized protein n=1 Tax=Pistacia integerrima TaxID=434235 RepID=A0ACC0XZV8_9ROSI|nr:hypothetical protein Pint_07601 [Pistacia integerrima]